MTVVQQQQVVQQQANIQPVITAVTTSQTTAPVNVGPPIAVGTAGTPPPALSATDNFQVIDEAAQAAFQTPGAPYPGPIAGIQNEYVNINTTNLDITAITPNAFIQTGSGNDTLQGYFGRNVLDAGGGSNVMIGGVGGTDTFIANIEGSSASLTDLIKDFHINDDVVIQGLDPSAFAISTSTSVGAFGQQLQIDATPNGGGPTASISIAGYSANDIGGKLSISFSTSSSGTPFMLVHANG